MPDQFARDVLEGLRSKPKYLLSKYFYDKKGDEIFQQIMEMPAYYPTNCEFDIFENNKEKILELFSSGCRNFDLIEFGAGDGLKTKILIKYFLGQKARFKYFPIDISENVIKQLSEDLKDSFHCINFEGKIGDYFEKLSTLRESKRCRKVILFLGSNIGNFEEKQAIDFLSQISEHMDPIDLLMVGFDLKKDPNIILEAYNDPEGITKEFNLNLLKRINRELGGNFIPENFIHFPVYNPSDGGCRSYLVSTKEQDVYIKALNEGFHFQAWEAIDMEVSQKYDPGYISYLAKSSGMQVVENFMDADKYFVNSVWTPV